MKEKRKILIPILVLIILGAAAVWYFRRGEPVSAFDLIEASGTIEAEEIVISPETSGRVRSVGAEKGEIVSAGDALLKMDDELLQAQKRQIQAASAEAEANLLTVKESLSLAEETKKQAEVNLEAVKKSVEAELLPLFRALDDLSENHEVRKSETSNSLAATNRAVREAQYQLDNFTVPVYMNDYEPFEAVQVYEEKLDLARQAFEPHKYKSSGDPIRESRQDDLDDAQSDFDTAVKWMEYAAQLQSAVSSRDKAIQDLTVLQDGPDPDDVAELEASIDAIQAKTTQALSEVEMAQAGIDQASALQIQVVKLVEKYKVDIETIEIQLSRQIVYAPENGVVFSRKIQPGEVVQAGAPLMVLGKLDDLTITVYVTEDRYGQINLGESAVVTVDSFPGEVFDAQVIYIADKAEFTPRNVQTPEGRKTTVFAVELAVPNQNGKLKPGMPADVRFGGF